MGPRDSLTTTSRWDAHSIRWEPLLVEAGLWLGTSRGGWHDLKCPFPHASADGPSDTGVTSPERGRPAGFRCFHASCDGRNVHDLLLYLEEELGEDEVGKYAKLQGAHLPLDVIGPGSALARWGRRERSIGGSPMWLGLWQRCPARSRT